MTGTTGDDSFIVDNTADTITEAVGGGYDTVFASDSYTLPVNVENITLTGERYIDATGNTLNNVLRGNASDNALRGMEGYDTGYGGLGDDWYFGVENIIENPGQGIDTMVGTGVLPDNVENLYMGYYNVKGWVSPGEVGNTSWYPIRSALGQYNYGNALDNIMVSPGGGAYVATTNGPRP